MLRAGEGGGSREPRRAPAPPGLGRPGRWPPLHLGDQLGHLFHHLLPSQHRSAGGRQPGDRAALPRPLDYPGGQQCDGLRVLLSSPPGHRRRTIKPGLARSRTAMRFGRPWTVAADCDRRLRPPLLPHLRRLVGVPGRLLGGADALQRHQSPPSAATAHTKPQFPNYATVGTTSSPRTPPRSPRTAPAIRSTWVCNTRPLMTTPGRTTRHGAASAEGSSMVVRIRRPARRSSSRI